jgi:hypothetical protein
MTRASRTEREAIEFLRRGRKLRGLSSQQFERIARQLEWPAPPKRRRIWLPVLAALGLGLIAGSAVARVTDLSRLPLIGPLFSPAPTAPAAAQRRLARQPRTVRAHEDPAAAWPNPTESLPPAAMLEGPTEVVVPSAQPAVPAAAAPGQPGSSGPAALPPVATPPKQATAPSSARFGSAAGAPGRLVPGLAGDGQPSPVSRPAAAAARASVTEASVGDRPAAPAPAPAVAAGTAAAPLVGSAAVEPPRLPPPGFAPSSANPPAPLAASKPAPPEDPIAMENRSFMAVLARWHRDHDAPGALTMLELHEHRFPHGQMRLEARLLRAEILLQQGREREGLALLDGVALTGLPRGRELETVRGELRIKVGRCAEGRRDLAEVLAKGSTDALGRRAAAAILLCP